LAGSDRLAIDQDGTCTALRQAAAEFGTVLIKVIVEDEEKWSFRRCIDGNVLSIEFEAEHHALLGGIAAGTASMSKVGPGHTSSK
jgi:hypothetical protein